LAFIPEKTSLNLCRFTEILGAMGFSATGETVIAGITGDPGNLIVHTVAAQHAEMAVMIGSTGTFRLVFHHDSTFQKRGPSSKSVPILAGNVLKGNGWILVRLQRKESLPHDI
jgi:hypothetical protein